MMTRTVVRDTVFGANVALRAKATNGSDDRNTGAPERRETLYRGVSPVVVAPLLCYRQATLDAWDSQSSLRS